jgi:chemotaxis response regulator CheB
VIEVRHCPLKRGLPLPSYICMDRSHTLPSRLGNFPFGRVRDESETLCRTRVGAQQHPALRQIRAISSTRSLQQPRCCLDLPPRTVGRVGRLFRGTLPAQVRKDPEKAHKASSRILARHLHPPPPALHPTMPNVVIIGAGPGGLVACKTLLGARTPQFPFDPIVLEQVRRAFITAYECAKLCNRRMKSAAPFATDHTRWDTNLCEIPDER